MEVIWSNLYPVLKAAPTQTIEPEYLPCHVLAV